MKENIKMRGKFLAVFLFVLSAMFAVFSSAASASEIAVGKIEFSNGTAQIFKTYDGEVTAKASITSPRGGEKALMITAVYDSTLSKLRDIDFNTITLEEGTKDYSSQSVVCKTNSIIRVFVWNSNFSTDLKYYELTDKSSKASIDKFAAVKGTKEIKGLIDDANKIINIYSDADLSDAVAYNVAACDNGVATVDAAAKTCTVTAENGKAQNVYSINIVDNMELKFYADYTGSEIVKDDGTLSDGTVYEITQAGCPSSGSVYSNIYNWTHGWWYYDKNRNITVDVVDDEKESGNKALIIDKANTEYKNNRIYAQHAISSANTRTYYVAEGRFRFANNSFGKENKNYQPSYRLYFGGINTFVRSGRWQTSTGKTIAPIDIDNWHEYTVVQHRANSGEIASADFYYDGKLVYSGTRGTDYDVLDSKDMDPNYGIGVRATGADTVGSVFMDDNIILIK